LVQRTSCLGLGHICDDKKSQGCIKEWWETTNTHWGTIGNDKTVMGTNESMLRDGGMTLGNNKNVKQN
jgi:hypothetical protein